MKFGGICENKYLSKQIMLNMRITYMKKNTFSFSCYYGLSILKSFVVCMVALFVLYSALYTCFAPRLCVFIYQIIQNHHEEEKT